MVNRREWRARRHLMSGQGLRPVGIDGRNAAAGSLRRGGPRLLLVRVVRTALSLLRLAWDISQCMDAWARCAKRLTPRFFPDPDTQPLVRETRGELGRLGHSRELLCRIDCKCLRECRSAVVYLLTAMSAGRFRLR